MIAIDEPRRRAARAAGAAYLLTFAVVVAANFGIAERLVVRGDAAATARNVLAHETLFRVSVVCDVLYVAGVVVLLGALYVLLAPVSRTLALIAAGWRLLFAMMWGVGALGSLEALRILNAPAYLGALDTDRRHALAALSLATRGDAYYGGLLFFALAATAVASLLYRAAWFPRAVAAFGVAASAWCALCAVAYLVSPDFARLVNLWWFDSPMAIFELVTGVLLLVRGLPVTAPDRRGAAAAVPLELPARS